MTYRSLSNPPPLLNKSDDEILARTKDLVVNGVHNRQQSAYVLLAAVSRESLAGEQTHEWPDGKNLSGGMFTTFLLQVLKSSPNAIHELTYKSLVDRTCSRCAHVPCINMNINIRVG